MWVQTIDPERLSSYQAMFLGLTEAFANSLTNKIRRVVVNAKGLDMGTTRLVSDLERDAVRFWGQDFSCPAAMAVHRAVRPAILTTTAQAPEQTPGTRDRDRLAPAVRTRSGI